MKRNSSKLLLALSLGITTAVIPAQLMAAEKLNILVIWGDDIGQSNISAYTRGMMDTKHLISIVSGDLQIVSGLAYYKLIGDTKESEVYGKKLKALQNFPVR